MANPRQSDEVLNARWCDVVLIGLRWIDGDSALCLSLSFPPQGKPRDLVCSHARDVRVEIASPPQSGGPPMTWDASFTQCESGDWAIELDFADRGVIRLICSAMTFRPC